MLPACFRVRQQAPFSSFRWSTFWRALGLPLVMIAACHCHHNSGRTYEEVCRFCNCLWNAEIWKYISWCIFALHALAPWVFIEIIAIIFECQQLKSQWSGKDGLGDEVLDFVPCHVGGDLVSSICYGLICCRVAVKDLRRSQLCQLRQLCYPFQVWAQAAQASAWSLPHCTVAASTILMRSLEPGTTQSVWRLVSQHDDIVFLERRGRYNKLTLPKSRNPQIIIKINNSESVPC